MCGGRIENVSCQGSGEENTLNRKLNTTFHTYCSLTSLSNIMSSECQCYLLLLDKEFARKLLLYVTRE